MLLAIALILAALALGAFDIWLFWRLSERDDARRVDRQQAADPWRIQQ